MAQDNFLIFPGLFFVLRKHAAKLRLHPKRSKQIGGNLERLNFLWMAIAGEAHFIPSIRSQLIEGMRFLAPVEKSGRRDAVHIDVLLWPRVDQPHDAIGVFKRCGMEQKGFGYAEYRCIRADTERERHDGDQRRKAMLCQHAQTEADILKE